MRILYLILILYYTSSASCQDRIGNKKDSLENIVTTTQDIEEKVIALNQLGELLFRTDTALSYMYVRQAIALSRQSNFTDGQADALVTYSRIYTEKGDLDSAIIILDEILSLEGEIENNNHIANAHISKGNIFDIKGEFAEALDSYFKAEAIFEEEGLPQGVGFANLGIGNIYLTSERYEESIKAFKKSARILAEMNHPYTSWPINNMASAMEKMGQVDSAEFYYLKSLEMKEANDDSYGASFTYSDLTELYINTGDLESAEFNAKKALELKNVIEGISRETIGQAEIRLGQIQMMKGDHASAISNFESGLKNAESSKSIETIIDAHKALSKGYANIGQYKKAYESANAYSSLKDSLIKAENVAKLSEIQTQYETAEKDAQLKIMSSENQVNELIIDKASADSKRNNLILIITVIVALFLLGAVVFAFRSIQQRKKNNTLLRNKNDEIVHQKEIIEETHKEITDSIAYAKRIQSAILPPAKLISEALPNSFVLYKPKDVVAGDFYWLEKSSGLTLFAAADCTGHGVPGAMVSVICNGALNRSVREFGLTLPGEILDKARDIVIQEFEKSEEDVKDGMDIALCSIEGTSTGSVTLKYAGAHNPLWVIRNNEVLEIKADKQPVGKFEMAKTFTTHEFHLEKGDNVYIFSDGYVDQFGGDKGKKFKPKALRELLLSIQDKSMDDQKSMLDDSFEKWRGSLEQVDDVCMIGIHI